MHNASTATYDYGCNTEIYGLIRIATDDAGSYPWLILRQIRECVTWALEFTNVYIARPVGVHYNRCLRSSVRGQFVKMLITLEPYGIF